MHIEEELGLKRIEHIEGTPVYRLFYKLALNVKPWLLTIRH